MGFPNIEELLKRPDPLLSYYFMLEVGSNGGNTIPAPKGVTSIPYDYVESLDISFNNIKIDDALFGNSGYTYYPGFHDVSAISVTFYEDVKGSTLKFLYDWKSKIKDFSKGIYYPPENYKVSWTVKVLNTKGEVAFRILLEGLWPSDTGNLSLDGSSSERVKVTQTFSIDNQAFRF